MSTVKISELTALSSADAADELVIVDDSAGVTKKITHANLANFGTLVTASAGITFGADTLDDYDEGTWTPDITFGNVSGISFGDRIGRYVKVGNLVFIAASMRISNLNSLTGDARIPLPFTPFAPTNFYSGFRIPTHNIGNANGIYGIIWNGASHIELAIDAPTSSFTRADHTDLIVNSRMRLAFAYYTGA